jgi:hypothetical protein
MKKRSFLFCSMVLAFVTTGCIKETYDLKKFSKVENLSPTIAFPAFNGNVTFRDLNIDLNVRVNSLQLIDTVDNFLKVDGSGDDNPLNPENFEMLNIDLAVINGFPLRVSLQMSLFNSKTHIIKSTVDAVDILEAAPVDSNGKVTGAIETNTEIKFTKEFLSSIPASDKIIFQFTLNTPNSGTNYVSIYSDYKIYFKAVLVFKPDINLKLSS